MQTLVFEPDNCPNLTKDLRLLESYSAVYKEVYPIVPPKVEYSLTEMGKKVHRILNCNAFGSLPIIIHSKGYCI